MGTPAAILVYEKVFPDYHRNSALQHETTPPQTGRLRINGNEEVFLCPYDSKKPEIQ